ncbi:winged helix-turn-helix transcriptional regulator [Clostridium gasigenes]|uniref:MarR family winged helix-turn-helix transcriptional regulator n=1 Tax=Clostridium gasigenes TaxID=94869 RepID=UPI001438615C|nr:MarR family winged helix-turn-helix transcriptional regulator [Clostridium gasigenes]NKF08570.1 winged helix-turn-helix transcriptional regulator [Clostridium gasigenes]QSW19578.1 winged helix-turn-helix transcriptional regulator [Clostridium gasigenes]
MDNENKLYETYSGLMKIKGQCGCKLIDELNMSELTLRQIEYIKRIGKYEYITISRLAEILKLSKPSITEMVKKFIKLDCVYKRQCKEDGRVQYIFLTERGKSIASFEDLKTKSLVDKMIKSLDENEINVLINILLKIKE